MFQILDGKVTVDWSRTPIPAGVPTSIEFHLQIACLIAKISNEIPDINDGTVHFDFHITTSSDYEAKENVVETVSYFTSLSHFTYLSYYTHKSSSCILRFSTTFFVSLE